MMGFLTQVQFSAAHGPVAVLARIVMARGSVPPSAPEAAASAPAWPAGGATLPEAAASPMPSAGGLVTGTPDVSSLKLRPGAWRRALGRLLGVGAFALMPLAVLAHQAPAGWAYDPECCSSHDCQQVADGAIREVAGGYSVVIRPGTHIMVPPDRPAVEVFIPHGDRRIRPSGDQHRHACVARFRDHVYCIYVPIGGV